MKKIITFVLAAVMLFTFAACSSTQKNELPQEYIGKWQANIISSLMDGVKTYETSTLELNKDGSATYQGKAFTWKYLEETQQIIITSKDTNLSASFEIDVVDGKQVLKFYEDVYYSEQDFIAKTTETNGSNGKKSVAVVIDSDNWSDYFEIVEMPMWKENAFGEIESVSIIQALTIKAEYQGKIDIVKDFNVAFALKAQYTLVGFEFDVAKQEYKYLDNAIPNETPADTDITVSFSNGLVANSEGSNTTEPLEIWRSSVGEREENGQKINDIYKYHNIEVTRVEGTIYLYE